MTNVLCKLEEEEEERAAYYRKIPGTTHVAGTLTARTSLDATRSSSSIAGQQCHPNMFFFFTFLPRYDGAPKPAVYEALELLQSECPHLYDELTASGEV